MSNSKRRTLFAVTAVADGGIPEKNTEGGSSDWVTGVLDEDIMAGIDLEGDNGDDDDDGEDYDQGK